MSSKRGGIRPGAGRIPLADEEKKKGVKIYIRDSLKNLILEMGQGNSFSDKTVELIQLGIDAKKQEE